MQSPITCQNKGHSLHHIISPRVFCSTYNESEHAPIPSYCYIRHMAYTALLVPLMHSSILGLILGISSGKVIDMTVFCIGGSLVEVSSLIHYVSHPMNCNPPSFRQPNVACHITSHRISGASVLHSIMPPPSTSFVVLHHRGCPIGTEPA